MNKFENVESYGAKVDKNLTGHNEFAYLILTSGYHGGMMSVLAILEQDFAELHEEKKRLSLRVVVAEVGYH